MLHWWMAVAFGAVLSGCLSGQTGSADCASPRTCACDSIANRYVLRARVVDVRGEELDVEVEEDYSSSPSPLLGVGARAVGRFSVGPETCRLDDEFRTPVPGDTVLVALTMAWGSGDFHMWVIPWTDPLDLVDRQIPVGDLREFAGRSYCDEDLPPEPCDDVRSSTCSVPRGPSARGKGAVALAVTGLLFSLRRLSTRAKRRLNPRPAPRS